MAEVVEHLPQNPKIARSDIAIVNDREKMAITKLLKKNITDQLQL
jgi:hypothetical protein